MKILHVTLLLALSIASASANHTKVDHYTTGSGFVSPDSESQYYWEYRCNNVDSLTGVYFTSIESEIDTNRAYLLDDCALMVLVDESLDAIGVQGLVDITLELVDPAPAVYFRQVPLVYCDGFGPAIAGCVSK
jgi:hypothetical protein